jgi:hypothetical protein
VFTTPTTVIPDAPRHPNRVYPIWSGNQNSATAEFYRREPESIPLNRKAGSM